MTAIRLIATDLDGTLVGPTDEHASYAPLREALNKLKDQHGTVWSVSTGRSIRSFRDVFQPMVSAGLQPDFVIVKHAYIYGLSRFGYAPHFWWNLQTRHLVWRNRLRSRRALKHCHKIIASRFRHVRTTRREPDRISLHFRDPESTGSAADLLRASAESPEHMQVFEYLLDLDMQLIPFTKGLALVELAKQLNIPHENVLAIGDGHNDLSMLVPEVAGMTGCPANAKAEVMELVHNHAGHISSLPILGGTIDSIAAHASGAACSDLPSNWEELAAVKNGTPRRSRHRHHSSGPNLHDLLILLAVLAALLIVLAHFGVLGTHLSRWITWPFRKMISLLVRLSGLI
jgi:HAD superfamily hydrolase (TIGR01484 family)